MFINTRTRTRTRTDGFVPGDKWSFFFLVSQKLENLFNCFFLVGSFQSSSSSSSSSSERQKDRKIGEKQHAFVRR